MYAEFGGEYDIVSLIGEIGYDALFTTRLMLLQTGQLHAVRVLRVDDEGGLGGRVGLHSCNGGWCGSGGAVVVVW